MQICQFFTKSNVLFKKLLSKHMDPVAMVAKQVEQFLMNLHKKTQKEIETSFLGTISLDKQEKMIFSEKSV